MSLYHQLAALVLSGRHRCRGQSRGHAGSPHCLHPSVAQTQQEKPRLHHCCMLRWPGLGNIHSSSKWSWSVHGCLTRGISVTAEKHKHGSSVKKTAGVQSHDLFNKFTESFREITSFLLCNLLLCFFGNILLCYTTGILLWF